MKHISVELLGLDYLNAELPQDEINHDEMRFTHGDSLINQFYNGNWSASVEVMQDFCIEWNQLLQYLENSDMNSYVWLHFDHAFWGELGHTLGRRS